MKHSLFVAVPAFALTFLSAAALQEPVKVDYKTSIDNAQKAYEAKSWGECSRQLRNALQAVQKLRIDGVRAAMPAAPSGLKIEDDRVDESNMWIAGAGCQVPRRYVSEDGDKNVNVNVQADFAMIGAVLPMLTNPMVVQANGGELLAYGKQKAVLTKQGDDGKSWKLQIVVDNTHLIDVDAHGLTREELLKMFDNAVVTKLSAELAK